MADSEFLLDQVEPTTGRPVFPRRLRASGLFLKGFSMTIKQVRSFALQTLHLVRQALGVAIEHRVLTAVLWFDPSETLAARLDRSIADLENIADSFVPAEVALTLTRILTVLQEANRRGELRDTLWATPYETLFDHLAHVAETLLQEAPPLVPTMSGTEHLRGAEEACNVA